MSHYAVAVFQDENVDLEDLLAPFDEELKVPHYLKKADIIAETRQKIEDYKNTTYARYLQNPEEYLRNCQNDSHAYYISKEFPAKLHWTDEDCYLDGIKYYDESEIRPDGSVFLTYNPNSKWDWYDIGGRFSNIIPLTNGEWANEASMDEVNIECGDPKKYKDAVRFWQLYVEGQEPETEEDKKLIKFVYYSKEYYTERFSDAHEYAEWCAGFNFYAALLPNYEWFEPGKMGWWGISFASSEDDKAWRKQCKEILKKAKENHWTVTIVDCHI